MATNSDFAQKLLRDLRLRKERMAASQHSGSHSTLIARGSTSTYTNRGPSNRGARRINSLEPVGSSTSKSFSRSSWGNRSLNLQESSTQIVPHGRGSRSSENVGDLSKALAFALQNGSNGTSASSPMLNFLHHIGWKSMEKRSFEKLGSSNQFPTYPYFHVKEISKGVQNLNQILRAWSNGLNFDRCSIEIGKDLLKGAMDLEESLRMLVNLQEASEYMVTPQSKNRIKLLEEDEEEEEQSMIMTDKRQLMELPRFSFDGPSRNSHSIKESAKADFKRLLALTYEAEQPKKKAPTSYNMHHKKSSQSVIKNLSSSPQSDMGKGRISNVIAKLMGLNELPEKVESKTVQKEQNSKKKEEMILKQIAPADTALQRTDDTKNLLPPTVNRKRIQGSGIPLSTPNSMSALKAENDMQIADRANAEGSKRATSTTDKEKEEENNHPQNRETRKTEKFETKKQSTNDKLQQRELQIQRSSKLKNMLKESIDRKGSSLTTEKNKSETLLPRNQQQRINKKYESQEAKHQIGHEKFHGIKINASEAETYGTTRLLKGQQIVQNKQPLLNPAISSKRSSKEFTDAVHSKELLSSKRHGDLSKDESSTKYGLKINSSQNDLGYERVKVKADVPQSVQKKPVHKAASQKKVGSIQGHREQAPPEKKHETLPGRKEMLHNRTMILKQQGPISRETKQRKQDKIDVLKEGEIGIMGSSSEASTKPPRDVQMHNKAEQTISKHAAGGDKCQSLKLLQTSMPNDSDSLSSLKVFENSEIEDHNELTSKVCDDHGGEQAVYMGHSGHKFNEASPNTFVVSDKGSTEIIYPSPEDHKKISNLGAQEPLTESEKTKHKRVPCLEAQDVLAVTENQLLETLIRSQQFINTAEALFKLDIPAGAVNKTGYNRQDDDSKLILDCAYELMKRLGVRQEIAINLKISTSCIEVRSLDKLIRQLHEDIESLKFYGGNGIEEGHDAADCMHNMLEKDVQHRVPNVNSMWDISWEKMMFASLEKYDVTRNLERLLLNGLLDELTKDLLVIYPFFN